MKKSLISILSIIAVIAIVGFGVMAYKYNSLIKKDDLNSSTIQNTPVTLGSIFASSTIILNSTNQNNNQNVDANNSSANVYINKELGIQFTLPSDVTDYKVVRNQESVAGTKLESFSINVPDGRFPCTELNETSDNGKCYVQAAFVQVIPYSYYQKNIAGCLSGSGCANNTEQRFIKIGDFVYSILKQYSPQSQTYWNNVLDSVRSLDPNQVVETLTPPVKQTNNNLISKPEWNVSFSKTSDWSITTNNLNKIILTQIKGQWAGDTINISYVSGNSITDSDAKFGGITYSYDKNSNSYMVYAQSEMDGSWATSSISYFSKTYYTNSGNPLTVFRGTGRWETLIVPIRGIGFIKFNISGGGYTQSLEDLVKTLNIIH
ncbi:MAG: hypothetical protein U0469_01625 [Candidatus Paceibacterota bacterium]|jgi:hypothetical protein